MHGAGDGNQSHTGIVTFEYAKGTHDPESDNIELG